jgi:hypothetical protein
MLFNNQKSTTKGICDVTGYIGTVTLDIVNKYAPEVAPLSLITVSYR